MAGAVNVDWPVYGGDLHGTRYSPLDQINRENVASLEVAWTQSTGDRHVSPPSTIECNPIVVDGVMYLTTAFIQVFAVDPQTGAVHWKFDPFEGSEAKYVNRGVSYWTDGRESRIFVVADHFLYSLDAATGSPVAEFGDHGRIDLRYGLDREVDDKLVGATTPGVIYRDLLILGSYNGEGPPPGAPGHIRAFDVRT
ncbi:MAG TPA: pyrroloquinoline quinone-dependent dehydrogenase, partial [Candidatus Glassbacteria bacterium]|nr:pyrroloquinoline quinone-dependent dehydrogenase [Candidatus Glassbacteria bacterium]